MTDWRKFLNALSKIPPVEENLEDKIAAPQHSPPAVPYTPPSAPYIPPQHYTPPATKQSYPQPRQSDSGAYGIIAIGFALLLGFGALMGAPKFFVGQENKPAQESRSSGTRNPFYDSEDEDTSESRAASPLERKIYAARKEAMNVYTEYRSVNKRMQIRHGSGSFGGEDAFIVRDALVAANEAIAKYKSLMQEWNDANKDTPGARLYDIQEETDAVVVYAEKNS